VAAAAVIAAIVLSRRAPKPMATSGPPLPTAIPATAAPIAEAPTPAPTAAPTAISTTAPAVAAARALPARADASRAHPPSARAAPPTVVPERRAKYPPDIEETAEVTLSPELAAECGGRSVGVSVVVKEDGSLGATRVISPVSEACDAKALETLRRYRFKPALADDGKPVEARFSFSVRF
jgi:TonB family protein